MDTLICLFAGFAGGVFTALLIVGIRERRKQKMTDALIFKILEKEELNHGIYK